jgi:MerR family transcriptional regulator, aldehyde-responsive regulator
MATTATVESADLTIQQLARRTGLAESALRYYERIGLINPVPRDESSGHRRYPPELVQSVEALACLRETGMSVADMRAYVENMRRGASAATDQRRLFEANAERLRAEITRLQLRERYVSAKARMWAARERDDEAGEKDVIPELIALSERLLRLP